MWAYDVMFSSLGAQHKGKGFTYKSNRTAVRGCHCCWQQLCNLRRYCKRVMFNILLSLSVPI
jgi:hypothetical protein